MANGKVSWAPISMETDKEDVEQTTSDLTLIPKSDNDLGYDNDPDIDVFNYDQFGKAKGSLKDVDSKNDSSKKRTL